MIIHDKVYDLTKFIDEHPYVQFSSPRRPFGSDASIIPPCPGSCVWDKSTCLAMHASPA